MFFCTVFCFPLSMIPLIAAVLFNNAKGVLASIIVECILVTLFVISMCGIVSSAFSSVETNMEFQDGEASEDRHESHESIVIDKREESDEIETEEIAAHARKEEKVEQVHQ